MFLHKFFWVKTSILFLIFFCVLSIKRKTIFGKTIWYDKNKIVSFEVDGKSTSQVMMDIFSFGHFSSGILLNLITSGNLFLSAIASISFELFENSAFIIKKYRRNKHYKNYNGDSIINMITDNIFVLLGFHFANMFKINK